MFGKFSWNSIAGRLFLAAAFWSTTILVIAGLGLSALNARSTEAGFDERLGDYLKALVADNGLNNVIDPRFDLAFGGWYWQITKLDVDRADIRTSSSLFAAQLPRLDVGVAMNEDSGKVRSGYVVGPGDHALRMIEREIKSEDGRFLVQVAANADAIQQDIEDFEFALGATFLVLALCLLGSTALALNFGLRPLRALQEGVAAIRRGESERIQGDFPPDIRPLAGEVNLLLDSNREVVERARTQVGNLAHALKTPLSVILNEAEARSPHLAEKVRDQAALMNDQVAFYLERARASARASAGAHSTDVGPVLERLVNMFGKIYVDRHLTFEVDVPIGVKFRGETQDLMDLIGNLLDNAGKWAHSTVSVRVRREEMVQGGRGQLIAAVDDDGPGLDPSFVIAVLERGKKLDETRPGSGLGLSIVVDLADAYGGKLSLTPSERGGLKATLRLPAA